MTSGDAKDIRDNTRAMKDLARSNDRLTKVLEALNDNLVAVEKRRVERETIENMVDSAISAMAKYGDDEHQHDQEQKHNG